LGMALSQVLHEQRCAACMPGCEQEMNMIGHQHIGMNAVALWVTCIGKPGRARRARRAMTSTSFLVYNARERRWRTGGATTAFPLCGKPGSVPGFRGAAPNGLY